MKRSQRWLVGGCVCATCLYYFALGCLLPTSLVAAPWMPVPDPVLFAEGPGIPIPERVTGKEFSDHFDRNDLPILDAEQVLAWDGFGGVRDAFDYEGSRLGFPGADIPSEVDALGNGSDALYDAVLADRAALLFSVGSSAGSGSPLSDGTIYFEAAAGYVAPPPVPDGIWAPGPVIDSMTPPRDVDGLEVWGTDSDDDADHYSIVGDPFVVFPAASRKVAVWEFDGVGSSSPKFFTDELAMAMDMQFGGPGDGPLFGQLVELMDVDATMVQGDRLLFSIAPLALSIFDPFLPDFDGGEIFVYEPGGPTDFLFHGGHPWDTAFDVVGAFGHLGVLSENINALEAVAIPEPAAGMLLLLGLVFTTKRRRRR